MSKTVAPQDIHAAAAPYGTTPFLLHSSSGSVRVNHVVVETTDSSTAISVRGFGRGLKSRLNDELSLSLLWTPHHDGGLSLIADGTGALDPDDEDLLILTVSAAVLHRPAPVDGPTEC